MADHFHSPIALPEAVALMGKLDFIEFALMAAASGDVGGPLTGSPTMRRNAANLLKDAAQSMAELAAKIDPLATETAAQDYAIPGC